MRSFSLACCLGVAVLPLLVACADEAAVAPVKVVQQPVAKKIPPQDFAPGLAEEGSESGQKQLLNDPSAPLDTPLCGSALREANQAGAAIYAQGLASSASSCPRNACFSPLTGTFIAADGNRSVCR